MKLEELRVYQIAMELGEEVWAIVIKWDFFSKDTVGKQLVRALDSIAANLSEGYGRYHFKETKNFSYYSRGSLFETRTWLTKAKNRDLISEDQFNRFIQIINDLGVKLNNYIHTIGSQPYASDNELHEPDAFE
jgi:four helix bundle protein